MTMTSPAPTHSPGTEPRLLAALRDRYLSQGYEFDSEPNPEQMPSFLGTYKPDAIARKQGLSVAIEMRQRRSSATDLKLKDIRQLFDGHPDWQFVVAYASDDQLGSLTIAASSLSAIRERLDHVRALEEKGELSAAFVLGWSLLEATLNSLQSASDARPRTPGTVIQTLAMLGYIGPDIEKKVRPLIPLRNRVVHGDLAIEPTRPEVELVFSAIEEALKEASA